MTPAELVDRLLARAATCSRNATAFHQQKLYAEAHVQDAKADAFKLAAEEAKAVVQQPLRAEGWGIVSDASTAMRGLR